MLTNCNLILKPTEYCLIFALTYIISIDSSGRYIGHWQLWVEFMLQYKRNFKFLMILAMHTNFSLKKLSYPLKGKFPQTTMWIGWVESNFRNPTVKFWAKLDNLFKRTNYTKFCMSPSLDGTLPESVISQENDSPLTLYIEFHNF